MNRIVPLVALAFLAASAVGAGPTVEVGPSPRELLTIGVWKVGGQYLREDNGKPIVWFQIGAEIHLTKWIHESDPKAPKQPPFREDEIERAWFNRTPGLYKVEYRGEKR